MDFKGAIDAHVQWKMKLRGYAGNPDKSLKPEEVCLDNKCALGQWIYGDGKKFATLPEYTELKTEHAKFHKCAAEIIKKIDAGKKDEAMADVNTGEYAKVSNIVVQKISAIKVKAGG